MNIFTNTGSLKSVHLCKLKLSLSLRFSFRLCQGCKSQARLEHISFTQRRSLTSKQLLSTHHHHGDFKFNFNVITSRPNVNKFKVSDTPTLSKLKLMSVKSRHSHLEKPVYSMSQFQQRYLSSCAHSAQTNLIFPVTEDRYLGVTTNLSCLDANIPEGEFDSLLESNIKDWRDQGKRSAWLHVPVTHSQCLKVAARRGFTFHHAEGEQAVMCTWLDDSCDSRIPQFATHQVGVAGVVFNEETQELLTVQDKNKPYTLWKFPGGLSDLGEDIELTAEREVLEETGVDAKFASVLLFRQQHEQVGAFGRSDIYYMCRLTPLTFQLNPCSEEIQECQWMHIDDLSSDPLNKSLMTKRCIKLLKQGLKLGWDTVDLNVDNLPGIYHGQRYNVFHRPLDK